MEFVRRGLGCRRSYFNYKDELSASGQLQITPVKPMPVQGSPPEPFNRDELLKQRTEEDGEQEREDEACVEVSA